VKFTTNALSILQELSVNTRYLAFSLALL
jgi:hypothetical protein